MSTSSRISLRCALQLAGAGLAAIAVASLIGCTDSPAAPPGAPSLAANSVGSMAVVRVIGLEPLLGAGENESSAQDINDLGQAVGYSNTDTPTGAEIHAVIWDANKGGFPETELLSPAGGKYSAAYAINSTGTVVVGAGAPSGQAPTNPERTHAARWVKTAAGWVGQDLGTLAGDTTSLALDVGDDGSIVGTSTGPDGPRGFLWRNGIMSDLGPADLGRAFAVNGVGQVAGVNTAHRAARSIGTAPALDLGTLGGFGSEGKAINASGQVAGTSEIAGTGLHAFLWTPRKGMIDLGVPPGYASSRAHALSNTAQVVGVLESPTHQEHAFAWARGKMLDLGVLPGYPNSVALGINNNNQVVGHSTTGYTYDTRATVWTIK